MEYKGLMLHRPRGFNKKMETKTQTAPTLGSHSWEHNHFLSVTPKSTNTRSVSTKGISNKPKISVISKESQPELFQTSTYSLSDGLAKTIRLLEHAKDKNEVHEAVYSLKRLESFGLKSPSILSLKMSQDYSQSIAVATSTTQLDCSPTLGMTVNGKFLILGGFCPKIESGFTLSDILEDKVDRKYFLSKTAIKRLMRRPPPRVFTRDASEPAIKGRNLTLMQVLL